MKTEQNSTANQERPTALPPATGSGVRCETCGHSGDDSHSCTDNLRERVKKLEKASHELESRVKWALNFMKCPGSGMMVSRTADGGFGESKHWTRWFADGLEMLGRYKVDRELLGLSKKEQAKTLKAREANHQNDELSHRRTERSASPEDAIGGCEQ